MRRWILGLAVVGATCICGGAVWGADLPASATSLAIVRQGEQPIALAHRQIVVGGGFYYGGAPVYAYRPYAYSYRPYVNYAYRPYVNYNYGYVPFNYGYSYGYNPYYYGAYYRPNVYTYTGYRGAYYGGYRGAYYGGYGGGYYRGRPYYCY